MRLLPALFAFLLLLAGGPDATRRVDADDGLEAARTAYARVVAALPAPAPEHGFRFQGVLRLGGKLVGHATLSAAPDGDGGWLATDRFVMKGRATPRVETSTATLDAALRLKHGTSTTSAPGDGGMRWTATDAGFEVRQVRTQLVEGQEVTAETVEVFGHEGTALNTMAATLLFCRLVLPKPASYATTIFEPEAGMKGKPALQPVGLRVLGEKDLQGRTVLAVEGIKGEKELTVLFDPETRAVVGMRLVDDATTLEILPGDLWVMPAPDAVTAGMRAMYGFAAKQLGVLDDVLHWPSMHAAAVAKTPPGKRDALADLEAWRKAMLAAWDQRLETRPAAMLQQVIASQRELIQQEALEDGRVRLTFPPMLRGMRMIVAPIDGVWHVVELPPPPKPAGGGEAGK